MTLTAAPNPYETGLDKGAANFLPLSPIGFLLRAAAVYPDRPAVVYGSRRYTWSQALARSRRLAAALAAQGVGRGDTVAVLGHNNAADYWAHLAQVRIVADVPQEAVPSYWDASAETRSNVLREIAGVGAKFLVTRVAPPPPESRGWIGLGATGFYALRLSQQ